MEGASLVHSLACSPMAFSSSSHKLAASLRSSSLSLKKHFSFSSSRAITSLPPFGVTPSPKFTFSVFCTPSTSTPSATQEQERNRRLPPQGDNNSPPDTPNVKGETKPDSSSHSADNSKDKGSRKIGNPPLIEVFPDGRVVRHTGTEIIEATFDHKTDVHCEDVELSNGVSGRLYLPKGTMQTHKLPLLVYFHGGGFCTETAFSLKYHNHVKDVAHKANVAAFSVNYRRAPEYPLPYAYIDSWHALKWVASHVGGSGTHKWLKEHVDFKEVFLAGDGAGGNIAHQMAVRAGSREQELELEGVQIQGLILLHPYFAGEQAFEVEIIEKPGMKAVEDEFWRFAFSPNSSQKEGGGYNVPIPTDTFWPDFSPSKNVISMDHPCINPAMDSNLEKLGCKRVLVWVAEKDILYTRGEEYVTSLTKSKWATEKEGKVGLIRTVGEGHVFHINDPKSENAKKLVKTLADFLKSQGFDDVEGAIVNPRIAHRIYKGDTA